MISFKHESIVIEIDNQVIKLIEKMQQNLITDNESGGMLIGSLIIGSGNIVIRDYTIPQKGDSQSRYRFLRRKKQHNALLRRKWEISKKTVMYLGEWHTHPETNPHYSQKDIKTWKKLLEKAETESDFLLFIIGGTKFYNVWLGSRMTKEIVYVFKGDYNGSDGIN